MQKYCQLFKNVKLSPLYFLILKTLFFYEKDTTILVVRVADLWLP